MSSYGDQADKLETLAAPPTKARRKAAAALARPTRLNKLVAPVFPSSHSSLPGAVISSATGSTEPHVAHIPLTLEARAVEQSHNPRRAHDFGTTGFRSCDGRISVKKASLNGVLVGSSGGQLPSPSGDAQQRRAARCFRRPWLLHRYLLRCRIAPGGHYGFQ